QTPQAACPPVPSLSLALSAPGPWEQARQILLTGPGGRRWSPEQGTTNEPLVREVIFRGPFPEESTLQVEIPNTFSDDVGRTLVNADKFPLAVKTGPFPPLANFSAPFGMIIKA